MLNKEVILELESKQKQLDRKLYDLLNEWMAQPVARQDPETALGMSIASMARVMADYSASHRLLYRHNDAWGDCLIAAVAKAFSDQHNQQYDKLSEQTNTLPGDPVEIN